MTDSITNSHNSVPRNDKKGYNMTHFNIVRYDSKDTNPQPYFKDLMSNLEYFNSQYDDNALLELPNWKDNSNYSSYPSLQTIIENFDPQEDKGKSFVCRVQDDEIWSSDSSLGGFDRAYQTKDKSCRSNLNRTTYNESEPKGFNDDDAGILNAYIRYHTDLFGNTKLVCVKNMGNHRFWMKKLANKGAPCEYLMKVKFHEGIEYNSLTQEDFIRIEAAAHHADAGDRNTQIESQKFMSGLAAKVPEMVYCYDFLVKNQLNYKDIMEIKGVEGCKDWLSISSVNGFNNGEGNGKFKEYNLVNVEAAINVTKRIAKEITHEPIILASAVYCIAGMFKSLSEWHDKVGPLFTKKQLDRFIYEFFEYNNENSSFRKRTLKLAHLAQTGGIKDFNYISASVFWRDGAIVEWYKQEIPLKNPPKGKQKNDRTNSFSPDHKCMVHFLNQITPMIRQQARALVNY